MRQFSKRLEDHCT